MFKFLNGVINRSILLLIVVVALPLLAVGQEFSFNLLNYVIDILFFALVFDTVDLGPIIFLTLVILVLPLASPPYSIVILLAPSIWQLFLAIACVAYCISSPASQLTASDYSVRIV